MKFVDNNNSPISSPEESLPDFYTSLAPISSFYDGLNVNGTKVPSDWYLAISDVVNSTQLIEEGRYKEVNVACALAIIGLARLYGTLKRPYVFGGDGIVFLLDPAKEKRARQVLALVARDVKTYFGIDFRSAIIPLTRIQDEENPLRIAKVQVSPYYQQAYFFGDGISLAERILKEMKLGEEDFGVRPDEAMGEVSYEGFTCRWQDVPSPEGETGALIIQPRTQGNLGYLLREIEKIIGSPEDYHPLRTSSMKLGGKKSGWKLSSILGSKGKRNGSYYWRILIAGIEIFLKVALYDLPQIREQNIRSSDVRKIGGSLKMIFTGDPRKMDLLENRLEQLLQQGLLYYGLYRSDAAHITCVSTIETGDDVHFVDGSNGGYALAALRLKSQIYRVIGSASPNHYTKLAEVYEKVFPLGPKTLEFVKESLPSEGRFLDLGCATGELTRNLGVLGHYCEGVDYTSENIRWAKKYVSSFGEFPVTPSFIQGDIFDFGLYKELEKNDFRHTVTCLGNTLAHGSSVGDLSTLFRGVYSLLEPGGSFIFSMLHYDALLSDPDFAFPLVKVQDYEFFRGYGNLQGGKLPFTIRLLKGGREIYESTTMLFPYSLKQLKNAGIESGFSKLQWSGDFEGTPLETDSLMVVGFFKK